MVLPSIRYSQLKHLHFVDRDNHEMGTLENVVLDEENLYPTFLILGSSFFEEFMEEIGERDNIDEIAPIDCIDHIEDDYAILSCHLDELETTDKAGKLKIEGYMINRLMELNVNLNDSKNIGEFYDYELNYEQSKFIISLQELTEELFQEGYGQKFNLSVTPEYINIMQDAVLVDLTSDEIKDRIKSDYDKRQKGRDLVEWH